jgi:tetratricopeptide (TPR) repeat protein
VKGQYDQAIADYNKALEINPKCAPAWYHNAEASEQLGRLGEALAAYKKFMEYAPQMTSEMGKAKEKIKGLGK